MADTAISISEKKPTWLAAFQNRFGPAGIIGMTIMGPGTISAVLVSASGWYYSMLWAVLLSATFAVLGMYMAGRVAGATEQDSMETVSREIHPVIAWFFALVICVVQFCVVLAEGNALAIVGQHMFSASSGGILFFDVPNIVLAVVLVLCVCAVYFYRRDFGFASTIAWGLMTFMTVCFVLTMFVSNPDWGAVFSSLVPAWPPRFEGHLPPAVAAGVLSGIIGGSFGLYSFVFHPFMLKERGWARRDKVKMCFWDTFWACGVMYGIFALSIFIAFGAVLYTKNLAPKGIGGAAATLQPLLGSFGYLVFVLGWFASVFTTTAGAAWTGCTPICALLGIKPVLSNPKFRIVVTGYTIIAGAIIGPAMGKDAFQFLAWAMGLLGLTGPLGVVAWLYLGNKKSLMKDLCYNWKINVLAIICLIATSWIAYKAAVGLLSKIGIG